MNHGHAGFELWRPDTNQDREAILDELQRVQVSSHFCNSKRYPALLRYIVEKTLDGNSDQLKERTIAVDVFGRSHNYDPGTDTVVRYTAGEVRKRLLLYYSEQGSDSCLRVLLPPGSYVPEFLRREEELPSEPAVLDTHPADGGDGEPPRSTSGNGESTTVIPDEPAAKSIPISRRFRMRRIAPWAGWAVAALMLALAGAGLWWRHEALRPESALRAFWAPVLRGQNSVLLCTGGVVFKKEAYSGVTTASRDADYTFTSMQTSSAIALIGNTTVRLGSSVKVVPAATTALTDLRDHSVILLGAYNTDWTLRLLQPLPIHFLPLPDQTLVDTANPQIRWQRDRSQPYFSADDYALVARFWEPTVGGWVVALAGLGRNGTEAATQFATSPEYMRMLRARAGRDFDTQNIEAVLKVNVVDGKTGAPSLVAVRMW